MFVDVNIFFALYASADIDTAKEEYIYYTGLPIGPRDKSYSIEIVDGLKIFDLDKIVEVMSYPSLDSTIADSPMWGEWKYQKVPHISQLVGYLLYKDYQADGLIFNSTKHDGKNIVLFFYTNSPSVVSQKIKEEKEL